MATRTNDLEKHGPGRTSNQGQKEASGGEKDPIREKASDGGGRKDSATTSRGGGSSRNRSEKGSGDNLPSRRK